MENENNRDYAGDLLIEISEINKIILDGDCIELAVSHTAGCSPFYTIYCC